MVTTRTVEYQAGSETFEGLFAAPDAGGPHPCVLVFHAWGGRSPHEDEAAERLAEMGYAAFSADLYGKGVKGGSKEENQQLMEPLVSDRAGLLRTRMEASLAAMTKQSEADGAKAAVTGFCFGGLCALDAARAGLDVRGAAAFHALLGQDGTPQSGPITAKVIAFQGFDDPMANAEDQRAFAEEMTARKADWQLHLYGGVMHAFTNRDANDPGFGTVYDRAADKRAWDGLEYFLGEIFA